jgi:hypothetical protein
MGYSYDRLILMMATGTFAALSVFAQTPRSQASPKTSIPSFTAPITTPATATAFQSFVDKNRGKLVHLNIQIAPRFSRIGDKIQGKEHLWDDLFVATAPCEQSQAVYYCAGAHYLLTGENDYTLEYYQGGNRLDGYFTINDNIDYHQGIYYMLGSVPTAQVLLGK